MAVARSAHHRAADAGKTGHEIIGEIDRVRRRSGAILAKWPARRTRRGASRFRESAKEVLEQNADVVIHSTSSSLEKVMDQIAVVPGSGVLHCFDL